MDGGDGGEHLFCDDSSFVVVRHDFGFHRHVQRNADTGDNHDHRNDKDDDSRGRACQRAHLTRLRSACDRGVSDLQSELPLHSECNDKGSEKCCKTGDGQCELIRDPVVDEVAVRGNFDGWRTGVLGIKESNLLPQKGVQKV